MWRAAGPTRAEPGLEAVGRGRGSQRWAAVMTGGESK